jgi:hypothetical protein
MRYKVMPLRHGLEMRGWGIWDDKISPALADNDVRPVMCSLDGKNPLVFRYMTGAYSWLALCEQGGLDLESGGVRADVYSDGREGGVVIIHEGRDSDGPVIRDHPLARRND